MKVGLSIEEKIRYSSEIIVEQPDSMPDKEFEDIISKVERSCRYDSAEDFALVLEDKYGIKVLEVSSGFPNNPSDSELEIIDVRNVKE